MRFIISTAQGRNLPKKVNLVRSSVAVYRRLGFQGVRPVPSGHLEVCERPRMIPQWCFGWFCQFPSRLKVFGLFNATAAFSLFDGSRKLQFHLKQAEYFSRYFGFLTARFGLPAEDLDSQSTVKPPQMKTGRAERRGMDYRTRSTAIDQSSSPKTPEIVRVSFPVIPWANLIDVQNEIRSIPHVLVRAFCKWLWLLKSKAESISSQTERFSRYFTAFGC